MTNRFDVTASVAEVQNDAGQQNDFEVGTDAENKPRSGQDNTDELSPFEASLPTPGYRRSLFRR